LSLGNWCSTFRGNLPVTSFSRVEISISFLRGHFRHLKLPRCLETSGTIYPVTQRHMPAAQRPEWKYMAQGFSHVRLSLACTRARVKWKSSYTPYFY
jgi:hypothetical protein